MYLTLRIVLKANERASISLRLVLMVLGDGLVPGAGTRRWGVLCRGHLAVGLCHILSFTAVAQHAQRAGKEGRRYLGSETTFPCYLLTWTSSFARDDDAQQERRNGFSAIATMLSLFSSLCVSFCSAAVRGARAPRGRRQAGLLFVFGFPS